MAEDRYETLLANYRNAWAGLHMLLGRLFSIAYQ